MSLIRTQLDRRLKGRGEPVFLKRYTGTGTPRPFVQTELRAIVRALTVEQLVGGLAAQNWFVLASPSALYAPGWPSATPPTGPIVLSSDPRMPNLNDRIILRGGEKAITRVAPIFDGGEFVRLELAVVG